MMKKTTLLIVVMVMGVCLGLSLLVVLGRVLEAELPQPTEVVVVEPTSTPRSTITPRPASTSRPTSTPRPKPTATLFTMDCKTLEFFEAMIKMTTGRTPDFVPSDIGVWDLQWWVEDAWGSYIIVLIEEDGCLTQAAAINSFDVDYGDAVLGGEMMGIVAGFFSTSESGLDWLYSILAETCPTAFTQHEETKKMEDGTLWEFKCGFDLDSNLLTTGLGISPKGW